MLAMINACVSHELRNPLNSIKALNIETKHILNLIDNFMDDKDITKNMLVKNMKNVLKKLKENVIIKESSVGFM